MALTIDQLEIEIVASSGKASTGLDRLASSLENLGSKLTVTSKLSTFAKNIEKIATAVNKLDTSRISTLIIIRRKNIIFMQFARHFSIFFF